MIRLFDEMRAPARMVAGGSQGGYPPASEGIAVPNGPQCVPALPVGGPAAPERSSQNSLPGGEAMRNATGRSFGWLWTPDKIAALQQMRRTMTRPQIAKAFGCSEKALHRTIERFKLGPVPRA